MALNIKRAEAERLAQQLAAATGESLTDAVTVALRERLEALQRRQQRTRVHAEIADLQVFVASLPDVNAGSAEELIGYDAQGLPR